ARPPPRPEHRPTVSALTVLRLEDRRLPATVVWDGGPAGTGIDWLAAANWAGDVRPGPADDAVIGTAGPAVVLGGDAEVRSVSVAAGRTLQLAGGALSLGPAASALGTLALAGGTLDPADGAALTAGTVTGPGTLTLAAG